MCHFHVQITCKYSCLAEKFSPKCFLTFVTKTRKFDFNPFLHQKNSKRYLISSSENEKGEVKENTDTKFDIGNRRKINVVIYKGV